MIAIALLGSIPPQHRDEPAEAADVVESAWKDEISKRIDDIDAGRISTIEADEAERMILAMTAHRFEFHPEAVVEASEAYSWYAQKSPAVAERFWRELRRARFFGNQPA